MKIRLFLIFISVFICFASSNFAQGKTVNQFDGRWYLTFDLPDSVYRTAVTFATDENGNVKSAVLGEPVLYLKGGTLNGSQIKLNGSSAYGDVLVTASITGEKIAGKWFLGFASGDVSGEREPANKPKTNYSRVFEQTWKTINDKFYDPNFNGVDWRSVGEKYRLSIEKSANDIDFVNSIRQMLKELNVSHTGFYYEPFENAVTLKGSAEKNSDLIKSLVWKKIAPDVGYLQIKEFTESPQAVADVDEAFAEIGDAQNLIIDLRGNTGGTLSVAMRIGDYLFSTTTPVGFFSTREGLKHYKTNSMDALEAAKLSLYSGYNLKDFWTAVDKNGAAAIATGGRAKKVYNGKVVMLIDERCASTTEGFVAVVKEKNAATLIGRKTRGAILSAVTEKMIDNWLLKYPKADFRTPQGKRIEGIGVEPDILAEKGKELEQALKFLEKAITDKSK